MALQSALAKVRDAPVHAGRHARRRRPDRRGRPRRRPARGRRCWPRRSVSDDDQVIAIAAVHALGAVFDDGAGCELSELLSDPRLVPAGARRLGAGSRAPRLDAVGRLVAGRGRRRVRHRDQPARAAPMGADRLPTTSRWRWRAPLLCPGRPGRPGPAGGDDGPGARGGGRAHPAPGRRRRPGADPRPGWPRWPRSVTAATGRGRRRADRGGWPSPTANWPPSPGSRRSTSAPRSDARCRADRGAGSACICRRDPSRTSVRTDRRPTVPARRPGPGTEPGRCRRQRRHRHHAGPARRRAGRRAGHLPGADDVPRISRRGGGRPGRPGDRARAGTDPVDVASRPTPPTPGRSSVAAERGIRRALTAHGRVDVLHLRMADVGSMAAAAVATRLGIPTVFTLAPDPHAVIHALDMTGALTRATFGAVDEREHYWFRTGLVRRLAAGAHQCALFPRPKLRDQLRDLLGVDIDQEPDRYTVVPEGIDMSVTTAAAADVRAAAGGATASGGSPASAGRPIAATHPALADLARADRRRCRPTAAGCRSRSASAGCTGSRGWPPWSRRGRPTRRCGTGATCSIVGGDLHAPVRRRAGSTRLPSRRCWPTTPMLQRVWSLAGHRPNDVVARWMAAAQLGLGGSDRPERGVRLRQPQGGIRAGADRGAGRRAGRRRAGRGRSGHVHRRGRHRVPGRHPLAAGGRRRDRRGTRSGRPARRRAGGWPPRRAWWPTGSPSRRWRTRWPVSTPGVAAPVPDGGRVVTLLVISPDYASPPAAAGHPGHRLAGRRGAGGGGERARPPRRITDEFGFERRRPATRSRVQPRGHPGRGTGGR